MPSPGWEPDPAFPAAPGDWQFWSCEPEPDMEGAEETLDRMQRLPEAPPRGVDDIQLAWVPPPGWPAPARGWSPPTNWKPDRKWPSAPQGWQFWQRDPVAVAARQQAGAAWEFERISILASSRFGQLYELNDAESRLRRLNARFVIASSPIGVQVMHNAVLPPDHATRTALHWSYTSLCSLCDHLIAAWSTLLMQQGPATHPQLQAIWSLEDRISAWSSTWLNQLGAVLTASIERLGSIVVDAARNGWLRGGPSEGKAIMDRAITELQTRLLPEVFDAAPSVPGQSEWQAAEALAAATLRRWGYQDARTTAAGNDQGIDVVGSRVVAQVKYRSSATGAPAVQQLAGVRRSGQDAVFFSRRGYTRQAVEYADEFGVALFTIELPNGISPANTRAQILSDAST